MIEMPALSVNKGRRVFIPYIVTGTVYPKDVFNLTLCLIYAETIFHLCLLSMCSCMYQKLLMLSRLLNVNID